MRIKKFWKGSRDRVSKIIIFYFYLFFLQTVLVKIVFTILFKSQEVFQYCHLSDRYLG